MMPTRKAKEPNNSADVVTYNNLGKNTLLTLFRFKKIIEVIFWTFPNDLETAIDHKKIKLGVQDFEHKGRTYTVDYSRVQNRLGKLIYNVQVNNTVGALSYVKPKVNRDAKNAHDLLQRTWLQALWSTYKMPLIIALVAIIVAIIMVILFFVMLGQAAGKDQIILNLTVENTNLKAILYPPTLPPQEGVVQ